MTTYEQARDAAYEAGGAAARAGEPYAVPEAHRWHAAAYLNGYSDMREHLKALGDRNWKTSQTNWRADHEHHHSGDRERRVQR